MPASKASQKITESKEFRTFFANTFGVRFGGDDVSLMLSLNTVDGDGNDIIVNEARLIVTPQSAKLLRIILSTVIEKYEKERGVIPMEEGKEKEIADSIKANDQAG